jgi:hypothetical protein
LDLSKIIHQIISLKQLILHKFFQETPGRLDPIGSDGACERRHNYFLLFFLQKNITDKQNLEDLNSKKDAENSKDFL